MSKKICIVSSQYLPHVGGVENYVFNLSRELERQGHEVTILTSQMEGAPTHEKNGAIEVFRLPTKQFMGGRFKYADELNKMGADITVVGEAAHITGVSRLHGAAVKGSDLRAAACLVVAALAAEGESTVTGLEFLDRGYEDLVGKLKAVGADIQRVQ